MKTTVLCKQIAEFIRGITIQLGASPFQGLVSCVSTANGIER